MKKKFLVVLKKEWHVTPLLCDTARDVPEGNVWNRRCVIIHLSRSRAASGINEAGDEGAERTHGHHVRSWIVSHYTHDSETRRGEERKHNLKKKRGKNPEVCIFKCCRRLSCKLQVYWSLCFFFFLLPWQVRDLISALPLTSRLTQMTSTCQHVHSNLSDQTCNLAAWTFPPLTQDFSFSSNGEKVSTSLTSGLHWARSWLVSWWCVFGVYQQRKNVSDGQYRDGAERNFCWRPSTSTVTING